MIRKGLLSSLILNLSVMVNAQDFFDIQGHRGARGQVPENTIEGFIAALDSGVTTLEMDVVITKDLQVVLSHEPYMSSTICLNKNGEEIPKSQEKELNIFQMTYSEVKQYNCGTKIHPDFPGQFNMVAIKPLLSDVIKGVERHIKSFTGFEVDYNIEIKSTKNGDNIYHPAPPQFSDMVINLVDQYLPLQRVIIQSFDFRVLKHIRSNYPEIRVAALVANTKSIDTNLANLGFKPEIYSPNHKLLNKRKIRNLHARKIKVIPWTVNDEKSMNKLIKWGVDGIITDYPGRLKSLVSDRFDSE